jgi:ABC-type amino acid transport substrate-binding protein
MVLAGRDLPKSVGWSTHAPTTIPARLFGIVWMIAGVVIFSLFTASAASFLTARQMQSIVNSPDDLHHVKLGTVIGAAAEDYMKRHNLRYTIYETPVQLLDALVAHRIDAAVYGSTTLAYYAKTAAFNNKVTVLRFSLRHDFAAIPMPTGSPLRKPINKAILHVMETKKWQAIIDKYVSAD